MTEVRLQKTDDGKVSSRMSDAEDGLRMTEDFRIHLLLCPQFSDLCSLISVLCLLPSDLCFFLQIFAGHGIPIRYKLVVLDDPDNVSQFTIAMLIELDVAGHT